VIEKRQIDSKKGKEILARLHEIPDPIISARQFIVMNFDELQQSGKTLRALHQFLLNNGLDVGSYEYFQAVYNSVKRSRKTNPSEAILEKAEPEKPTKPENPIPAPSMVEKAKNENDVKKRPRGVGLRPLCLADGTEIEIDPDTGARLFKIKSKETEE
jgi:hypothetical protein